MTSNIKEKLGFAQGTLGVRMKHGEEQPVNLVEVFASRDIHFPETEV